MNFKQEGLILRPPTAKQTIKNPDQNRVKNSIDQMIISPRDKDIEFKSNFGSINFL